MKKQPQRMDGNALKERLLFACAGTGLTDVQVISDTLSDAHNGGLRAVLFASGGQRYVYKPRSGAADHAWAGFVAALSPLLDVPLPRAVRPVTPAEAPYTIVPFVDGREAADEAEIRLYHTRCGALLALCMVLGATDLHGENLVADGDSPVLVDVETLLGGVTQDQADRPLLPGQALMATHLLPNWMLMDGETVDVGALTGAGKNLPLYQGERCPAWRYAGEVCRGFARTMAGLIRHREAVDRALDGFAAASFRKLLRPTDVYDRLIAAVARQESEEARQACARRLERAYVRGGEDFRRRMAQVCQSEMAAVARGDVPYFFSRGDECCLRDAFGAEAQGYYALSPVDAARRRLAQLQEADGEMLARLIAQNLRAARPLQEPRRLTDAHAVFELVERNAVEGHPCAFVGLQTDARGNAYFQSIGFDLYEGLLGVIAFYAALYEARGDASVRRALERRWAAYRDRYVLPQGKIRAEAGNICLTGGLGGHILVAGYVSRCLKDERYISDAAAVFSRFDFPAEQYAEWDVYSGAAGLLTALPLLDGHVEANRLTATAHLLAEGIRHASPELTGYGHGAAGLALALGAAQRLGCGDYTQDVLRLLQWENALFDEKESNWPDLRRAERGFMKGLCAGAPGVGLSRLQLMRYVPDERVQAICREDIGRVRRFLAKERSPLKRDTLCCGNAAMAEAERALTGSTRGRLNESPRVFHALDTDDFPPGLMQGYAGVGYALARQERAAVSSLFVWEDER